ncbi:MAG TPA: helix-turn-helix domain-containing protein [Gemmataceae bacterium]|nr:helix-turn-helix domain-containing protein [Gemmataceae bacterium]
MTFVTRVPGPPLSDFVELLWFYDGYDPGHPRERLLPTGAMELVIDLDDGPMRIAAGDQEQFRAYRGPLICGTHSSPFVIDTSAPATVLGVHFKPGGAFPFLPVSAGELQDTHVPLADLWGRRGDELRDRTIEARTPDERLRVLEQCLRAMAPRPLERHAAVSFALSEFRRGPGGRLVSAVAKYAGLSRRRFTDLFRAEVGLTPKRFCRVVRFQEVLQRVQRCRRVDWASVALSAGYFDQAHFINDFREFCGVTPTTYLECRGDHLNHLPIPM